MDGHTDFTHVIGIFDSGGDPKISSQLDASKSCPARHSLELSFLSSTLHLPRLIASAPVSLIPPRHSELDFVAFLLDIAPFGSDPRISIKFDRGKEDGLRW
jgi:hypothetical protein